MTTRHENHRFTPAQQRRLEQALATGPIPAPEPPLGKDGRPADDTVVLERYVTAFEAAAALNARVAAARERFENLRGLVVRASMANPSGCGHFGQDVAAAERSFPSPSSFATPEEFIIATERHVSDLRARLEPAVRLGHRE